MSPHHARARATGDRPLVTGTVPVHGVARCSIEPRARPPHRSQRVRSSGHSFRRFLRVRVEDPVRSQRARIILSVCRYRFGILDGRSICQHVIFVIFRRVPLFVRSATDAPRVCAPLRGCSSLRYTTGAGSRRRQRSRNPPTLGARTSLATWCCSLSFSPTLSLLAILRARRGFRGRSPFSCCWRLACGSCPWWRLLTFSPFSGW